ncbi:hypothetical protein GJV26_19790 [Massilia dura]|uniref:Uncharacterized protein n=1 Tax=Pseudoduganella dura TaxID=321982 RepID=A0A6I3XCM4_9BURK|nr:hypothetical protein [Pseudoduganella dura]MUI14684.1 hypothetical protein [Pseudoduganella dura]GGY04739.1 hypothetical protein GCM10007386_39350 [Pseudoduganella dura]
MTTIESRSAIARDAAAQFATASLIARCRIGAEQALMPQGRWLAANTQGLIDWLEEGGFASPMAMAVMMPAQLKTAARGRCSRVQTQDR